MKDFRMKAEIVFAADDIDDAFLALALHFLGLLRGEDDNLIASGQIDIEPV